MKNKNLMTYFIPFWYIDRVPSEILDEGQIVPLLLSMMFGGLIFIILFIPFFLELLTFGSFWYKLFFTSLVMWAIPNYYISYKYYQKDN